MSFDDSDAIREGEPPYSPAARRLSEKQSLSSVGLIAFGIGFALAGGVLCAAAVNAVGFSTAKPWFVVGLLLAFSASMWSLTSAPSWGYAGILGVVLLIVLSFVPVYVEHVGPPDNPRSHRHMLWWPDHVH